MSDYIEVTIRVPRSQVQIEASPKKYIDMDDAYGFVKEVVEWEANVQGIDIPVLPPCIKILDWDDDVIDKWAIEDFKYS